ncbi:hypothetical protein JTE90_025395 [Oedothorax gibbosus]|uniref:Peroxisomal membrane protein PEX16 n=1 Tax=Oedothorax gibbosus TaxID=931172 RepID=A0AAV6UKP5_9ARAC|nr:hypothetical protein JTE90_025395 [Oedothorax gibbosus]
MAVSQESFIEKYVCFVTKNPLLANEIEVGLKWASYIIAGRFSQSPVVTELIHCSSKLLTLLNDSILRKSAGIPINVNVTVEKLKTFLTVLEYSEVFAEVAAHRLSGTRAKWLTVVLIHLTKCAIRLLLLLSPVEGGLHLSPPISPLNRKKDVPGVVEQTPKSSIQPLKTNKVEVTFTLRSTGRVMRTLEAAPPLVSRSWKLPESNESSTSSNSFCRTPTKLSGDQLTGEIMYMFRPLVHLASMGIFGEFSWKPLFIALGIDVTSLHLLKQKKDFNKAEKQELSRRALLLILYLLRSPFYDQYSKQRIINTLQSISNNVMGSGLLLRPLIDYIPEWQQLYFYSWSS